MMTSSPTKTLKYVEALRDAADQMMALHEDIFIIGLGVSYKNGADGTTSGLKAKYPERVLDTPLSEHALTGLAVGAAINGLHPIVHHGRVEFSLFAADQIFTQAAKWNYMFGGNNPVPIVFRINVGRQWGNGPQHTQSLYPLFGNALGLKVVIPSTPYMAKGLLVSALRDKNPVILLEPRWLFSVRQNVPDEIYSCPLDNAKIVKSGDDLTLVAYGDGLIAAYEALALIKDHVDVELIDLVSINPVDYATVNHSIQKTGRLLTVDTANQAFNIGSEVIANAARQSSIVLRHVPVSLACPDVPCPTSTALTEFYYPTKVDIANAVLRIFSKPPLDHPLSFEELHLAPNITFQYPESPQMLAVEG